MGYHTSPYMVEENKELLGVILAAITHETNAVLDVAPGLNISTEQYRLRRILAATDNHREVCGGVFAGLGQRCTIRVKFEANQLEVTPKASPRGKGTMKLGLTEVVPNEMDMLTKLRSPEHMDNITVLNFEPSPIYNIEEFTTALSDIGWTIHANTLTLDDKRISVAVERDAATEPTGFDILERTQRG